MELLVRPATEIDLAAMVELSELKRTQYQAYQPVFWRKAEDSRAKQRPFFAHQLAQPNVVALVAEAEGRVVGFLIAKFVPSPPVYAAGLTCVVDDYCVQDGDWTGVGHALLEALSTEAKERGATQMVVVAGHLDQPKRGLLAEAGYSIASEWWVRPLQGPTVHQMGLFAEPFDGIKAGRKRFEIRLFDEKRQRIALGDRIQFTRLPDGHQQLTVEVLGLRRFERFVDLYSAIPLAELDCEGWSREELLASTYEVYSPAQEEAHGVLAIELRLLGAGVEQGA